jgi:hypothetical protein
MSTKGVPVRLFMARVWLPRMRKVTAATVKIVVLVAFVAGMYVSGPEYVKFSGQTVSILCLDGRMANFVWEPAPVGFCENKRNGTYQARGEFIRRTTMWERLKLSIVGSTLTPSTQRKTVHARQRRVP